MEIEDLKRQFRNHCHFLWHQPVRDAIKKSREMMKKEEKKRREEEYRKPLRLR